jgi:hypothetical protein
MTSPVHYLEVHTDVFSRKRMRSGLQQLERAGVPIAWFERAGWWRSAFTICAHPVIIGKLQKLCGGTARESAPLLGRQLDMLS